VNEVERIKRICRDLNLPDKQWILNGSGVLALHGIDRGRPMGDMDVFCTTEAWFRMLRREELLIDDAPGGQLGRYVSWNVFTTDGRDPRRMCDPPYLYAEMYGLEVNIFFSWRERPHERGAGDMYIPDYIAAAEIVDGIPCAPLGFLISWKLTTGRTKDLTDVIAIREHLQLPERTEA
jgi:hypothetical protein